MSTGDPNARGQGDFPASVPLVGRDGELAALRAVFERAASYHAPQVVLLIGNQGTGKSRLLHEFGESVAGAARVYAGVAARGERASALTRLLRSRFGIVEGEPDDAALARV